MKILCISDTHTKHSLISKDWLIPADVIVHGGDISNVGRINEVKSFLKWFDSLDYKHKIFIAGNHDFCFERFNNNYEEVMSLLKTYPNITYLMDEEIIIDGVKFYGSPWQPEFYNWAFNLRRGAPIRDKWNLIPKDTHILITHGPVYGICDMTPRGEFVGCEELLNVVANELPNLKAHICGHIHHAYGSVFKRNIHFANASSANEQYNITNQPILIEI
jgi:Icc-related predicted phosphoesterase